MLRKFISLAALAIALVSSAQEKPYSLNIGEFSEITIANDINVIYKSNPDSAGYAVYKCLPEIASQIAFSNDKNKLKIQLLNDQVVDQLPTITIYSLALSKATNWGDSTLIIEKTNPGSQFKAKVIGNGNIIARDIKTTKIEASVEAGSGHIFLSGKAQSAKYSIVSAGAIEAASLEASAVKCVIVGTGSIDCYVADKLTIMGAGTGTVYYKGNPSSIKKRGFGFKAVAID